MASTKIAFLGWVLLLSSSLIAANRVLLDAGINNHDDKDGEIGSMLKDGRQGGANIGETWEMGAGGGKGGKKGYDAGISGGGGIGIGGGGKGGWGGKGGHLPVVPVQPIGGGKGGWPVGGGGGGGGKGGWGAGGSNWGSWGSGGGWAAGGVCAACPPQCLRVDNWQGREYHKQEKTSTMQPMKMEMEDDDTNE